MATDTIWNWKSSRTNCVFRNRRGASAELKVPIQGLLTLQQTDKTNKPHACKNLQCERLK